MGRPAAVHQNTRNKRIVVIEDSFPVISETFILDQISGLIDRGLTIENWSLHYLEQQVRHSKVHKYGLVEKTRYLRLPSREFRATPDSWVNQFAAQNPVEDLGSIAAFHVHFGPNFIEFEPLFQALDTFLIVSFYGYDASKYILENGERCYDNLFRRANLITTPTECMKNELIRIGCPQHKIIVHRCGVEIPEQVQKKEKTAEMVTMLSVARFVEKKGIEFSLRAVALCPNRANFRYRIIGDGPLKSHLMDLAGKLGISDTVEFLGFLPIEKIREEMAAADIVVLTSVTAANGDQEGLPVTLVEAQAMGLPVISSYHSGIPELVIHGSTGLLSPERDVKQIAVQMDMLVNNPEMRSSMGTNGRQRAHTEFNIERLNDRLATYLSPPAIMGRQSCAPSVHCPICGSCYDSFLPFGETPRANALCPQCHSLERHRLLWLFLQKKTNIFTDPQVAVLDIAPVPFLSERFQKIPTINYLSIDLRSPYAMQHMDLTNLSLPDNYFDCIICCHVLEHVPDDRKAISELYRVMKPGAWGILQVPLKPGLLKTIEDPSISSPQQRLILYGNEDHVRYYGLDYRERLEAAGFDVCIDPFARSLTNSDAALHAILQDEDIYLCVKPFMEKQEEIIHRQNTTPGTEPFLSIVIPTYNRQRFISDAIQSALMQTYQNFEILVVDDGSNDGTSEIVRSFSDARLRYIAKEHSGAPATRNRCIAEAQGEFLVWLDSDDMLLPDTLRVYSETLATTPDADVLYGDLIVTDREFRQTSEVRYQDWYGRNKELLSNLFHTNCIPNPGTLVRKNLYDKIGTYDESFRRAHDYELWTRFALKAVFKHVPRLVVKWRWHDANMSSGSVTFDTSFDARIIHKLLETVALSELFPTMDWSCGDQRSTSASVFLIIAQRLLELKDLAGTTEYLKKSYEAVPNPNTLSLRAELLSNSSGSDASAKHFAPSSLSTGIISANTNHTQITSPGENSSPMVSVIVPTFNRPEMLAEALKSIISQTFQDFEIIIVNDAGVDVAPLVMHFNTKGTIRYINKETNQGLAAARNTGIKAARGKYLAYLDDDDSYYPDHLETLVNFLEEHPYQVAYSNADRAIQEKIGDTFYTIRKDTPYGDLFDADRLLVENYIPVLCVMHEKKCLDQVGLFDESLPRHEDWDLWIRLSQCYTVAHIPKITAEFSHRDTDQSGMTSGTLPSMLATLERVYDKSASLANTRPKVAALRQSYLFDLKNRIHGFLRSKVESLFDSAESCNFPQEEKVVEQLRKTGANNNQILAAYYHSIGLRYGTNDQITALSFLSRALAADPVCCPVHRSIAEALLQLGEFDKAVRHCEVILSQEPNDPELMEIMATMAHRLGDTKKAEGWNEKAKELRVRMLAA